MKHAIFFLFVLFFVSSCKDRWNEDDKTIFKKACLEDAQKWAGSPEKAETYCNCLMEKIVLKYPHENDALENLDSVVKDPAIHGCKEALDNK